MKVLEETLHERSENPPSEPPGEGSVAHTESSREKLAAVAEETEKQNAYLASHPRANVEVAAEKIRKKIHEARLEGVRVSASDRILKVETDKNAS